MSENNQNNSHEISFGKYVLVWVALLALTSLTVSVAGIHFGDYTILVGMGIAAIKATLVVQIFMHIKVEDPIFKLFILVIMITLLVIFGLTSLDFLYR